MNIQQILLNEIFNLQMLQRFLSHLLKAISFSLEEELNLLLIDSTDLSHIQQTLQNLFPSQELLLFDLFYYFDIISTLKLNTIMTTNEIIFVLKIAILYPTPYNYQTMQPSIFGNHAYSICIICLLEIE